MDKERLRIPSDSSSGSSSRGGASPSLSPYCNNNANYMLTTNGIGPPNSQPSFSSLLPQPTPQHTLPGPPPGLPHPSLGAMYPFPPCTTTAGYQNLNYPLGMTSVSGNHSQLGPHFNMMGGGGVNAQYELNGYSPNNHLLTSQATSPPPGYNNFYGTHHPSSQHISQPLHSNQQQTRGPLHVTQRGIYNQSGDSNDLDARIHLLLGSTNSHGGGYDNGFDLGGNELSTAKLVSPFHEETMNSSVMSMGNLNKDGKQQSVSTSIGGVMNPIIENLVGSMSMCNGTYTHFGPSTNQANKQPAADNSDVFGDYNLIGRQNGILDSDSRTLFSRIAVTPINKENRDSSMENGMITLKNQNSVRKQTVQAPEPLQEMCQEKAVTNVISASVVTEQLLGESRASSPRESLETLSRPQTPGKPSYLEVLTKAGGTKPQSTTSRKASSTSSSPVQSALTASSDSVPNLSHRKSVDYYIGATASSPASSCPSASSSPATKQRNIASGNVKGKENISLSSSVANFHSKQSSISKKSPSSSPSHSIQNQGSKGKSLSQPVTTTERKVLSSQNSASNSSQKSAKVKNGKLPTERATELNESAGNEESEWGGWKTYTSRGRNNNLNSVGNKNSQKKASNGSCNSDTLLTNDEENENDEEEEDLDKKASSADDIVTERKSSSLGFGAVNNASSLSHSRKQREKEKPRNRKEDRNWRNCVSRRVETLVYLWLSHMISALTWLWSLVTDVASLSASLGVSLMLDFYVWTKTKALPNFSDKISRWRKDTRQSLLDWWSKWKSKISSMFSRGGQNSKKTDEGGTKANSVGDENILSLLGPDRNIILPANGDEALKRLLSVKGQDPYSILGVRSDSSDETIRRYYKRQAVLVHPDKNLIVGAEEAFKILARAFEMVGDPVKRAEYHQKLMEAQAKEKFCGEIGNLLEQLRKKMEAASSTIRCTKCNSRHKKSITDRPLFAARFCSQCRIHHAAREGELWAERGGWFGITWNYFACMDAHIWEINEWARCQKTNLKHIKADAHCVMYRLVAGGNNHQGHHNQHCHGAGAGFEEGAGSEADEWDSLINNLYKSPPGSSFGKTTGTAGKPGCCAAGGASNASTANGQAAGKRRKGKRNK